MYVFMTNLPTKREQKKNFVILQDIGTYTLLTWLHLYTHIIYIFNMSLDYILNKPVIMQDNNIIIINT